ncbi:MAG: D-alanyl-D-alanine carboxypeptidase family protein [Clostridia bacterium]
MIFLNNNISYGYFEKIAENSGVIIDANSGSVIYNKNMNKKIYPASTTKILTAILTIENLNLNSNITVSSSNMKKVPTGSSVMYLKAGDTLTVKELLYGLLLNSGNDAAIVLAENISGSINNFSLVMNEKAKSLGCINSNFVNPHGFYNKNHYSTAYDMALIMKYASKNDAFREICETQSYLLKDKNLTFENTNQLLKENLNYVLGGKTGFVDESGNVFISYAIKDDIKVISALYDGINLRTTMFKDTKKLTDTVFENYTNKIILKDSDIKISYLDKNTNTNYILGINNSINSLTDNSFFITKYILNNFDTNNISGSIKINCGNKNWNLNNNYELKVKNKEKIISKNIFSTNILYLISILFCIIMIIIQFRNLKKLRKITKKIKHI